MANLILTPTTTADATASTTAGSSPVAASADALRTPGRVVANVDALTAAVLLGLAMVHALAVGVPVVLARGTMEWDPAHHTLWGMTVYQDLHHGQLLSALFDSYRQIYWPFLHSWAIAASMALFGPGIESARYVSLVSWEATALLLGLLALRISRSRAAALLVSCLWLTSAAAFFRFGTEAFTEAIATTATAASFLAVDRAVRRGGASWAIAGAAAMAVYLTKTDYGVLVLLTAGTTLLRTSFRDRRALLANGRAFLAPIGIIVSIWFAYLPKLPSTIHALQNRPLGPPRMTAEGLWFHFSMLAQWCGGAALAWLGLACVAATLIRELRGKRGHPLEILAATYVAIGLVLHELSQTKDEKHIVKLVPWLFLLIGVRLAAEVTGRPALRIRAWALGALLLALGVPRISGTLSLEQHEGRYGTETALEAILERLEPSRRHLVVGGFTELAPYETMGEILRRDIDARIVPDPLTLGSHTREWWDQTTVHWREHHPWIAAVEPPNPPGASIELLAIPPKREEHEPADPASVHARYFPAREPDRVFVVVLDPSSPWHRDEYVRYVVPGGPFVGYLEGRGYRTTETLPFENGVRLVVMDRGPTPSVSL